MKTIHMKDLYTETQSMKNDEVVLDVRSPEEYKEGHIPGSINIPVDQVLTKKDDLKKYSRIFIHCKAGGRASAAYQALASSGLSNLVCVAGSGMPDWAKAGYPVEK